MTSALLIFKAAFVKLPRSVKDFEQTSHASKRSKLYREACKLLCSSNTTKVEFWVVCIIVLLSGALNGIVETFLLIYLRTELKASF